jgi:hypothetical protein
MLASGDCQLVLRRTMLFRKTNVLTLLKKEKLTTDEHLCAGAF